MAIIVPRETPLPADNSPGQTSQSAVQRAIAAMNKRSDPQGEAQPPTEVVGKNIETSEEIAQPEKPEEALSPKLVELARREKMYMKRQEEMKAREEALAKREAELTAKDSEYKTGYINKSQLAANPLQALIDAGLSQEQIMQHLLNGNQPVDPNIAAVRAEVQALKDAQEEQRKRSIDAQQKNYDNAVNQIRTDVKALVADNADFESVKAMGMEEAVVELIKKQHAEDGTLLSIEDAATRVEAYIVDNALKMAALNKVKAKLTPAEKAAEELAPSGIKKPNVIPQAGPPQQQLKTLTNAATTAPSKALSDKDRRARAIAAYTGQLK